MIYFGLIVQYLFIFVNYISHQVLYFFECSLCYFLIIYYKNLQFLIFLDTAVKYLFIVFITLQTGFYYYFINLKSLELPFIDMK